MKEDTCLILCNGPSLSDIPADFINSYETFGLNGIFLREDIQPVNYYVAINPLVIQQYFPEIRKYQSNSREKYIRASHVQPFFDTGDKVIPLFSDYTRDTYISEKPLQVVHEGWTVTFVAIQLAIWKQYKRILFVGLDHYYNYEGSPNEQRFLEGEDTNHFHPKYFSHKYWHNPDIEQSEHSFQVARDYGKTHGIEFINLSTRTALSEDIFPRDPWLNWRKK
jgi:hypothetical protein